MPEYQEGNGINLEEAEPIERLLTGQSMQVKAKGKETGLYFKGLRLGRLKVKGNRVLWSEK
jgi:16S rRNA (cytosine1407-C5)-methyltransferase